MTFRLIYEGQLLSSQARDRAAVARNRHAIRKQIHAQLKDFWYRSYNLIATAERIRGTLPHGGDQSREHGFAVIAKRYERCGIGFIPLVTTWFDLVCSLDILFLRREEPGAIVQGGDIDNRVKTLFDGLRLPSDASEITEVPTADEQPFYCLLEDDRLITEVSVTTDRLLGPLSKAGGQHDKNDVVLVVAVEVKQTTNLW